jgi:hypothetical protein
MSEDEQDRAAAAAGAAEGSLDPVPAGRSLCR